MSQPVIFFFAFLAVLAMIGAAAWLVRRFAGNRLGANANRGRMPRLAVIDAAAVDGRRRLVLVRRDNVEHLLMIGGPTDIVVEPNIVRANAGREPMPQRPNLGGEPAPRLASPPEASWETDGVRAENYDLPEPAMPELPPRPPRPTFADEAREPRRPAPAPAPAPERRTHEQVPGSMPEPLRRPEPRPDLRAEPAMPRRSEPMMPRAEPPLIQRAEPPVIQRAEPPVIQRSEPPAKAPPVRVTERPVTPQPSAVSAADQNLAEMAQRLEAALRRPADSRPEPAEPRVGAPPVAPEPPPGRSSRAPEARPEPATPPAQPAAKSGFENLEDEMASLLGRPKTPS